MKKITDYTIAKESNKAALVDEVQYLLTAGWQPLGAPFPSDCGHEGDPDYNQAVVKYED
jgi:hypothetical protein